MSFTKGPRVVIWLLTSKCNLACRHCYTARFPKKKELDEEQALDLVESMANSGIRHIGFSGGEVFLRQDALRIMKRAFELGMSTSVVTNGSLLTEEVAQELADSEVFTFLSIDGARKETHERIRGSGTWSFVTAAVEKLQKFSVRFRTIMAVSKLNYTEVSSYLSLAQEMGALAGCLIPVMPAGRASKELILQPDEMVTVLQSVDETANELRFPVSLWCTPFAKLVVKSSYVSSDSCRQPNGEVDLDPQGNVLLCDVIDIKLSNVRDKSFWEAWQEQETNSLAKSLTKPELTGPCLDCPLGKDCLGGCFARAQLMTGDIHAPDPLCPRLAGLI